jgi:dihydroorotate dehydrogenase (fumarate)
LAAAVANPEDASDSEGEKNVDLSTNYLGLKLPHPLILGASPIVDELDDVKRAVEAGAAAVVMHSLFEEQIRLEQEGTLRSIEITEESSAEALSYFPKSTEFRLGPDQYLEQIGKVKQATGVPVIGSLNGTTASGWLRYAKLIQQAGADALELNVYFLATDPQQAGEAIEARALNILRMVKNNVTIPVAVKLSPFYSSLAHFAGRLDVIGADGLVLFNRFYQPDIDLERLEAVPLLSLSDSSELLLRLRWLAILSGRVRASLAVSGGVHTTDDALKAVMAGASAVQLVSAVLKNGSKAFTGIRQGMEQWLVDHHYESIKQAHASMSLQKCPSPTAFERANYMKVLAGWGK